MTEELLNTCRGIVMNTRRPLLIVELFPGFERVFLTNTVRLKNRDNPYNEVYEAQDITVIAKNMGINFAGGVTEQQLLERCQSIPKESFKWGHDRYMWLTLVDLNRDTEAEGRSKIAQMFRGQ